MGLRIYWFLIFICLLCQGEAQETYEQDKANMASICYNAVIPVSGFSDGIAGEGINGYVVSFHKQIDTSIYSFMGIEFNYNHIASFGNTINTGVDSFEDVTSSAFATMLFSYRHFSPIYKKHFEPFIQGGLGPQFFFTTTSTTFFDGSGATDFRFEENSLGLAYEVGLGFLSNITSGFNVITYFAFRGGSSVSYLSPDPNGLTTQFPIDSFLSRRDAPNYIKLQIGISYSY